MDGLQSSSVTENSIIPFENNAKTLGRVGRNRVKTEEMKKKIKYSCSGISKKDQEGEMLGEKEMATMEFSLQLLSHKPICLLKCINKTFSL